MYHPISDLEYIEHRDSHSQIEDHAIRVLFVQLTEDGLLWGVTESGGKDWDCVLRYTSSA